MQRLPATVSLERAAATPAKPDRRAGEFAGLRMILLQPLKSLRLRINRWVASRVTRQLGPVSISRQRIYIVPTRFGYGYAILLLVMLLGAMNYSNSMVFALTFLLAGLGLLGMHHTHANLLNLRLRIGRVLPVFAGEIVQFELQVENPSRSPRYTLELAWPEQPPSAYVDALPDSQVSVMLPLTASQRGWLRAPRFAVATEFPFGLLHAWSWIELDMNALVYPAPAAPGRVPPLVAGEAGQAVNERSGIDEFIGLRSYLVGDTLRSIHWKSFAKLDVPLVKRFGESVANQRVLDWRLLTELDTEARLSQLTRWVLDAEAACQPYTLVMPEQSLGPALGASHRHACLSALALHGVAA